MNTELWLAISRDLFLVDSVFGSIDPLFSFRSLSLRQYKTNEIACWLVSLATRILLLITATYTQSFSCYKQKGNVVYVTYITWAGGICLICTHKLKGVQRPRASADISGKSRPHMLHMLCNTSGTLKNLPNLPFTVLHLYIMTGAVSGYGFLILTFLWRLLRYTV